MRKVRPVFVLLLVAMMVLPMSVAAQEAPAVVYVDDNFDSSTPGWNTDHFASIQAAIDAVAAGGTVNVEEGTYTEQLTIAKNLVELHGGSIYVRIEINRGTEIRFELPLISDS